MLNNLKLKASHEKLMKAIKKYGRHLRDCPYFRPIMPSSEIECTCGLEQIIEEAKKLGE